MRFAPNRERRALAGREVTTSAPVATQVLLADRDELMYYLQWVEVAVDKMTLTCIVMLSMQKLWWKRYETKHTLAIWFDHLRLCLFCIISAISSIDELCSTSQTDNHQVGHMSTWLPGTGPLQCGPLGRIHWADLHRETWLQSRGSEEIGQVSWLLSLDVTGCVDEFAGHLHRLLQTGSLQGRNGSVEAAIQEIHRNSTFVI